MVVLDQCTTHPYVPFSPENEVLTKPNLQVIIGFGYAIIMSFLPETLPRLVIAKAASKAQEVDPQEEAILRSKVNVMKELRFVTTMTFKIMFTEPIVLLLGIYNGFAYGILFLYLDGVYDVFAVNNGLS